MISLLATNEIQWISEGFRQKSVNFGQMSLETLSEELSTLKSRNLSKMKDHYHMHFSSFIL